MPTRAISISLRLTLWFGAILLAGWFVFGAAMWFNLKHTLTGERHQTLDRRLDRLQDLLLRDSHAGDQATYDDFHEFASATGGGLVEAFRPSGARFWPSPSAAAEAFPWPTVVRADRERFIQVQAKNQSYWVVQRQFTIGSQPVVLAAAAPEAGNLLVLDRFWNGLVTSAPLLLLIAMASGYWISRRALSPVDRITGTLHSIGIRNLSERLPFAHSSDELQRLAETCNDMLERLEVAVRKLKQFTADASHELRGPLSLTRTIAEVALRNPSADEKSRSAFQEIVNESARAAALLEQMLDLARVDSEPIDIALEPVNLFGIVEDACTMARTLAHERGVAVSLSSAAPTDITILGHAASLRRLLWILLDNAIKYTPATGQVDVSIHRSGGCAVIEVADSGIGIGEADLPHIFDRFYRADPSRGEVEGSGLGLSIAKWIADIHRARIRVRSLQGLGSSFSVVFDIYGEYAISSTTRFNSW